MSGNSAHFLQQVELARLGVVCMVSKLNSWSLGGLKIKLYGRKFSENLKICLHPSPHFCYGIEN